VKHRNYAFVPPPLQRSADDIEEYYCLFHSLLDNPKSSSFLARRMNSFALITPSFVPSGKALSMSFLLIPPGLQVFFINVQLVELRYNSGASLKSSIVSKKRGTIIDWKAFFILSLKAISNRNYFQNMASSIDCWEKFKSD